MYTINSYPFLLFRIISLLKLLTQSGHQFLLFRIISLLKVLTQSIKSSGFVPLSPKITSSAQLQHLVHAYLLHPKHPLKWKEGWGRSRQVWINGFIPNNLKYSFVFGTLTKQGKSSWSQVYIAQNNVNSK